MNLSSGPRKLLIKCLDSEAYSLHSVVSDPRAVKPYDVQAACNNIILSTEGKKPSLDVASLVSFIFGGYFQLAHRTGLYNRQRKLWDSLARITAAKVQVARQGVIVPVKLPVIDLEFYNGQNDLLIMARLVKAQRRKDFEKRAHGYFKTFVKKVTNTQAKKQTLQGAFICFPSPAPVAVIHTMGKLIGSNDPVSRYESRLPLPADISLNILEMTYPGSGGTVGDSRSQVQDEEENGAGLTESNNEEPLSTQLRMFYPEDRLYNVDLAFPKFPDKR